MSPTLAPTAFTRLAGCQVPIQQAPVGSPAAHPDLPRAVSLAGGHGMLAGVRMTARSLEPALDELNAATRAYGVNFIQVVMDPGAFEVACAKAPLVELYVGPPAPELVERIHAGGGLASRQVVSAEEARAAQDEGCDLVVARAIEAGGRATGGIGMLPLLDSVLDAVEIPVVAAGGVGSGRGVAAALTAGASAVRMGTRFLAAAEAHTHPVYRQALIDAGPQDTVLTDAFSVDGPPTPHRVLRSALEAAGALTSEVAGETVADGERRPLPRFAADNPDLETTGIVSAMALYAGESVGAVRSIQPAAEIISEVATLAAALLSAAAEGVAR